MADLLTHYVSARLCSAPLRRPPEAALLALGVFVPDLVDKFLYYGLPFLPDYFHFPSHTPVGLLPICWAASLAFAAGLRLRAFAFLYAGSLLHVAVDGLKNYMGRGTLFPFYPFSLEGFEAGLYNSEDVFWLLPGNLVVLMLLGWWERRR